MAKQKQEDPPLRENWVCEGCWNPTIGKDPPDKCPTCGHEFFENLVDIMKEKAKKTTAKH